MTLYKRVMHLGLNAPIKLGHIIGVQPIRPLSVMPTGMIEQKMHLKLRIQMMEDINAVLHLHNHVLVSQVDLFVCTVFNFDYKWLTFLIAFLATAPFTEIAASLSLHIVP